MNYDTISGANFSFLVCYSSLNKIITKKTLKFVTNIFVRLKSRLKSYISLQKTFFVAKRVSKPFNQFQTLSDRSKESLIYVKHRSVSMVNDVVIFIERKRKIIMQHNKLGCVYIVHKCCSPGGLQFEKQLIKFVNDGSLYKCRRNATKIHT